MVEIPRGRSVRQDLGHPPDGSFTEYVNFAGQTIAEKDQTGAWTDYIFGNARRIARASNMESRVHLSGTNCSNCGVAYTLFNMPLPSYTLQAGDTLDVTQYAAGSTRGGLEIVLSAPNSYLLVNDQNGNSILNDTVQNQWSHRQFAIPQSLVGQSLASGGPVVTSATPAGAWNLYFRDITIVQANGTVVSLYKAGNPLSLTAAPTGGVTQITSAVEAGAPLGAIGEATVYSLGDHLGTAQMEFSSAGYPTWQGQFAPFGAELDTTATANHYKFTGLERDTESGLDHATFRQYASNMGRWTSPDPYNGSIDLTNPQSLNRYAYVNNMPLRYTDPSGLEPGGSAAGPCYVAIAQGGADVGSDAACVAVLAVSAIVDELVASLFTHPKLTASHTSRPWDEHGGYVPQGVKDPIQLLNLPSAECEFGACGFLPQNGKAIADYGPQFVSGLQVIYQTFLEMEKANVKGDDKFFHCTAMARASSLGPGGVGAAVTASWGREITDTFKYRYYLITGNPHGLNFRDSIADSKDDLRADYAGINGGLSGCTQYKVRGLP